MARTLRLGRQPFSLENRPVTPTPIADWGTAVMSSLAAALALLLAGIPKIVGFLVILIMGWLIASAIAGAVTALLRAVKFNDVRSGPVSRIRRADGHAARSAELPGRPRKWFIRLIVLVCCLRCARVARRLAGAAAVADVAAESGGRPGHAGARWPGRECVVQPRAWRHGRGRSRQPDMLATIARVAVWGFAIVVAVNQIGIATTLVNTLFMASSVRWPWRWAWRLVWAAARRRPRSSRGWYERSQQAAPRVAEAADRLQLKAKDREDRAAGEPQSVPNSVGSSAR